VASHDLSDLDREDTHASRAAVYEHVAALFDVRYDALVRSLTGDANAGCLVDIDAGRERRDADAGAQDELPKGAVLVGPIEAPEDELAGFERFVVSVRFHAICAGDDAAAEVHAWGGGLWDHESGQEGDLRELKVHGIDGHVDDFDED
jgi:hypothetical protein